MAHEIVIPRLGWSMDEGTFIGWLKKDGELVRRGDAIFELEGEKALQAIEAVDEGILRIPSNSPQPGSVLKVGAVIGFLVTENEVAAAGTTAAATSRFCASPRAKRIAAEFGIDWTQLSGTGDGGRIRESDVRAALANRTPSQSTQPVVRSESESHELRIPQTVRRRTIAQRMVASRQQTVPVTLTTRVDASNLVNLREQFKAKGDASQAPSYQDIITKLVGEALKQHLLLTGRWEQDAIVLASVSGLHIGVAVDTDEGLIVPVIRNVGGLTLVGLAEQSRQLIQRARTGKLVAADMQGGVFTITNLGAFGIDAFTPVINAPESAILGFGAIRLEPVVLPDGQLGARHQLTLSLTFDHRIIDGAPAARFLQSLAAAIANPSAWLLSS